MPESTNPSQPRPSLFEAFEGLGTLVLAVIAVGTIAAGAIGGWVLMHYRVQALETWQSAHVVESAKQREQRDASIAALKDQVGSLQNTSDHRLTVLEESFKSIQTSLADLQTTTHDLDRKVDDLAASKRGH